MICKATKIDERTVYRVSRIQLEVPGIRAVDQLHTSRGKPNPLVDSTGILNISAVLVAAGPESEFHRESASLLGPGKRQIRDRDIDKHGLCPHHAVRPIRW